MKILVITDVLWRNDNGVGNSYSNIFEGMKDVEIANICCQTGQSQNGVSAKCFQISETTIIKSLINNKTQSGRVESAMEENTNPGGGVGWVINSIKRSRLQIFFWLRNLIWKTGKWKSGELNKFIDDFKPDIIFGQLQDKLYLNQVIEYVRDYTNKPLCLYAWDDVYSLKQFYISPLFWIDRFIQRKSIRNIVNKCSILYVISEEQKAEYSKYFGVRTELLYKGKCFNQVPDYGDVSGKPLKLLYTGNLYSGRYNTLLKLCRCLKNINSTEKKAELMIYSGTSLTNSQIKKIDITDSSHFCGNVSEEDVQELQSKADILVHLEPFSLKGSCLCRLSFSTKLVDYFYKHKCILAIGSSRCSSIKYLKRYNAAVIVDNTNNIHEKFKILVGNSDMIAEYAAGAWNCGKNNHQISVIQEKLYKDFSGLCNKELNDNEYIMDN